MAVATSIVDCLSRMEHGELSVSVLLSKPVENNLRELATDLTVFKNCKTLDSHGIKGLWKGLDRQFSEFDLVFTVFGPAYFAVRNTRHLFGFAQPNILYPNNPLSARSGPLKRLANKAKFELQAWFFSRADELVVELEHVKSGLQKRHLFQQKKIHLVYSSVHSVFNDPKRWTALNLPDLPRKLRLGVISRNYPHKNLSILADVKQHLVEMYQLQVDIFVTFTPEEWESCDLRFRENIINVGGLSLSQCPTFYVAMDGVVFPSLLECFSAVPIETMMIGRPLFASNLSFIRDVCGDFCQYFDPLDPADIARSINTYFSQPSSVQQRLCEVARAHVQHFPGPHERAEQYLNIINTALV